MSKLLANDAKLASKLVDSIFCSELLGVVAPPFCCLLIGATGFKTVLVGCKTSPNASNSKKSNNEIN